MQHLPSVYPTSALYCSRASHIDNNLREHHQQLT